MGNESFYTKTTLRGFRECKNYVEQSYKYFVVAVISRRQKLCTPSVPIIDCPKVTGVKSEKSIFFSISMYILELKKD